MKAAAWIAKAAARAKWKKSEARPQPASGQSAPTPPHSCAQLMRPHTAGRPPSGLVFPTFPPPAIPRLYLDTRFCLANRQKPRSARQCCAARYQIRKNLWITNPCGLLAKPLLAGLGASSGRFSGLRPKRRRLPTVIRRDSVRRGKPQTRPTPARLASPRFFERPKRLRRHPRRFPRPRRWPGRPSVHIQIQDFAYQMCKSPAAPVNTAQCAIKSGEICG